MATSIGNALGYGDAVIIPGTTPEISIAIDDDIIQETTSVRIDVAQNGNVILQVNEAEIVKENRIVRHTFSQSETYAMSPGVVEMQVHGITGEAVAWKTDIFQVQVGESLTKTIIV